ncbi:MAG: DUF2867 domain-containing protein, partial [Thermoanaerobaculia bacterium]|nr:DUF2867 domain-containing protein [Thermoanaerobaculia bacterium]
QPAVPAGPHLGPAAQGHRPDGERPGDRGPGEPRGSGPGVQPDVPEARVSGAAIRIVGVEKRFGDHAVLHGIDLEVAAGEFVSLLGPSGCGKTTLLRILAGIEHPSSGRVEIGGADPVTYGDLMREYAARRGLKRWFIPVPLLTPRLSSLWLGLTTPVYARVGRKLIEGVSNPTVVRDDAARRLFPEIVPMGLARSIERALANEDEEFAATRWSDALSSGGTAPGGYGGLRVGTRLVDSRTTTVPATAARAFAPIRRIGGESGWYYANVLWRLRGFLDLLFGGVGVRRGRRHPELLAVGDALDFWRVEAFEPERRLRLAAEMKLPGRAWLEFEVTEDEGGATIRQTAQFDPAGLAGLLYWYGVYPLHVLVFRGMLRGIAARAHQDG